MTESVLINSGNEEKLRKMFKEAQKGCRVRRIEFEELDWVIDQVEEHPVLKQIPLCSRKGIYAFFCFGGGDVANSYRGIPMETVVYLHYRASGWAVAAVDRCRASRRRHTFLWLTQEAKEAAVNHFLTDSADLSQGEVFDCEAKKFVVNRTED